MYILHFCATLIILLNAGPVLSHPFGEERSSPELRDLSSLLRREEVLRELKITEDQRVAIRDSRGVTDDLQAERKRRGPSLSQQEFKAFDHRIQVAKINAIVQCLSPAQIVRLEQLLIQYQSLWNGPSQSLDRTLEKSLPLSDDQKTRIRDLETDLGNELRVLMWVGCRDIQRELVTLLSLRQRTTWSERIGEDFEFRSARTGLKPLAGLTLNFYLPRNELPLSGYAMLMYRAEVQKELELIPDQLGAASHGNVEAKKQLRAFGRRIEGVQPDEVAKLTAEVLAFQQQLLEEKAKARRALLLPHQERRLEELHWRSRSVVDPVRTINAVVGLDDQQRERMAAITEELCERLTGEMWEFKRSADRELTQVLTPAQRAEWSKQVGEEFKFRSTTRNFQILRFLR